MSVNEIFLIVLTAALFAGILSGVPVMLAIAGAPLLVAVIAATVGAFDLTYLAAYPQRVFGIMDNTLLIAVPLFVLMGLLLERSKLAEEMLAVMARLLGSSASGLAYAVLIVSALIAASTGIIGATIVMLGLISLPALLASGLGARLSSGLICASGTLGQIIPPSIVLVLLGDQISNAHIEAQRNVGNFAPDPVSVADLFAGALFPGLLLVALYAAWIFVATTLARPARRTATSELGAAVAARAAGDTRPPHVPPSLREVVTTFVPPLGLILAVLGSILAGVATTTEAAAVGAIGTLLLAGYRGEGASRSGRWLILAGVAAALLIVPLKVTGLSRIDMSTGSPRLDAFNVATIVIVIIFACAILAAAVRLARSGDLYAVVHDTVKVSAMVFGIVLAASMLSLVFRGFEGDEVVHEVLSAIPGDRWGALIAVMVVMFVLGFILEFVEIIFIVIPIVGPVLLAFDFHPVWFGVMVAMNLQTSFLTPPFGFALFYFRSVAPPSINTVMIYRSVVPFVALQILAIVILVAFPELATWLPDVVFR